MRATLRVRRSTRKRKIDGIAEVVHALRDKGWTRRMIAKSRRVSTASVARVLR